MLVFLEADSTLQFHTDKTHFRQSEDAAGKRSPFFIDIESCENLELEPRNETPEKLFTVSS
jgi:hypothetical protein